MNFLNLLYKAQQNYNQITNSSFVNNLNNSSNNKSIIHHNNTITKSQQKRQELLIKIFEQNLELISKFLIKKQNQNIRLICRGISYIYIIQQLWTGIKLHVAEKKLQDFDDYQFVQEQPKQISKQDKKIRIHSLKKNIISNSISKNIVKKRQPSNIKQKNMAMSIVQQELNPFQKTEIGFKRLLKTNNVNLLNSNKFKGNNLLQKKSINSNYNLSLNLQQQNFSIQRLHELLDIPKEYSIDDLIINAKDQWVKNIHRANNLITVVKKWNGFHTKFLTSAKRQENQLLTLMKKAIKIDGCLMSYGSVWEQQPYASILNILEGAYKNTLIQEQLNKLGRQFLDNHKQFMEIVKERETQHLITNFHELYQKISSQKINKSVLEASIWVQGLNSLDQGFQNMIKLKNQKIKSIFIKSILNVMKQLLGHHLSKGIMFDEDVINLRQINMQFIIKNSQFCQLVFEIFYNLYGKFANIINSKQNNLNSQKTITENLGNKNSQQQLLNSAKTNFIRSSIKLSGLQKSQTQKLNSTKGFSSKLKSLSPNNYISNTQQNFKQQKTLFGILWNISKYFDKLQKQMIAKEKKKRQQSKVLLIKNFLQNQAKQMKQNIIIFDINEQQQGKQEQINMFKKINNKDQGNNQGIIKKSLIILQSYYKQFKIKIQKLKQEIMVNNDN